MCSVQKTSTLAIVSRMRSNSPTMMQLNTMRLTARASADKQVVNLRHTPVKYLLSHACVRVNIPNGFSMSTLQNSSNALNRFPEA